MFNTAPSEPQAADISPLVARLSSGVGVLDGPLRRLGYETN